MRTKYCAVSSKLKAMHSLYLSESDYNILLTKKTVPEVCSYLKNNTGYSQVLENVDDRAIHRLDLEMFLNNELKKEYIRMYKFVGQRDRKMLYLWFMRSEVEFLKRAVHCIYNGEDNDIEILPNTVSDFFKKHTKIDIDAVGKMKNFDDLIKACENTVYYEVLTRSSKIDADAFSVTMRLDSFYYRGLWKAKDSYLDKAERNVFEEYAGRDIDALNILWIYRSRKYFNVDKEMIYTYLIPVRYKLKESHIRDMVESDDEQSFFAAVSQTPYSMLFDGVDKGFFAEECYQKMIYRTAKRIYKNYPMSMSSVFAYFRLKEIELDNLQTIIEGVRYSFDADAIAEHICI